MRIKHMFKKTVRDIRGEEQENTPEVPDNLMRKCNACKAAGIPLTLRLQPGYDHSYYFISSFMDDHLRWHAQRLG